MAGDVEPYVEWKPFYSVGDATLDAEHKRLLGIINDLHTAIQAGHGDCQVRCILERLVEHTTSHFDNEERVMLECGYPSHLDHKAVHSQMQRRLLELQLNSNAVASADLLRFLKDWWLSHIQNQDKAYVPYLNAATGEQPVSSDERI